MVLDFSINKKKKKKKKKHNIKERKLNCSLHTKKTNNTNKLIQISYQPLQKFKNYKTKKKRKKGFFLYWLVHPKLADTPGI